MDLHLSGPLGSFLAADMALEARRQRLHRGGVSCQMFFFPSCFAISLGSYDTAAHGQGENTGERGTIYCIIIIYSLRMNA